MKIKPCDNTSWIFSYEAYDIYQDCMYLPTYEKYIAEMKDFLKTSFVKVYVCYDNKKIVGILIIRLTNNHSAEIEGIAVSHIYRNRGFGKMMIEEIKKSEGLKKIIAQTDEDAIGFYQHCGFHIEPERKEYPNGFVIRYNCVL